MGECRDGAGAGEYRFRSTHQSSGSVEQAENRKDLDAIYGVPSHPRQDAGKENALLSIQGAGDSRVRSDRFAVFPVSRLIRQVLWRMIILFR